MSRTLTAEGVKPMRPVEVIAGDAGVMADGATVHEQSSGLVRPLVEASKPGITRLVTVTSAVGFALAAMSSEQPWSALAGPLAWPLVGALLGTALSSSGANTLNQWWERERDARMQRTARRPLPRGALSPRAVLVSGVVLSVVGIAVLWAMCGIVPAAVSLTTILTYLFMYTPLKPVTPWSTLVGAVPGALPPVIGWTAAASVGGTAAAGAALVHPLCVLLFAIMFVWQVPHTLAIAWMYKDDYARGGHRLLPVVDGDGRRTARAMVLWSVLLLPLSLAPGLWMDPAPALAFTLISGAMGLAYIWLATTVARTCERADARRMFFASIIHLPLLLISLVAFVMVTRLV